MGNPNPVGRCPQLHRAFGEFKSLPEWAVDERCVCSYSLLRKRVEERGWEVVRALTQPARQYLSKDVRRLQPKKKPKPQGHIVSAWGLSMSLSAWAAQSYVPVSVATLWRRIVRDGWPPEKALMFKPGVPYRVSAPASPWDISLGEYLQRGLTKQGPRRFSRG